MHRCRSAANGKLLFGICPKTHEGPREGDPRAFALRRQRDEEKLRRSVKQEERRCRRFRLAARLGAYGSSVPSDKSYNRVTYSAAQGSLPRFTFSSQADGIGSNSLAPPPCRPPLVPSRTSPTTNYHGKVDGYLHDGN